VTRRALAIVMLLTAGASANGRFPSAMTVTFGQDPKQIYVGATFGLIFTTDGATWNWVCEKAVGYTGYYDPVYAVTSSNTILAGIYDGLAVSRDGGCTFNKLLMDQWISDVQIGPDGKIWLGTANTAGGNDVYVSSDDAASFAPTGLTVDGAWWKSVRIAPGDAKRVYAGGYKLGPDAGTGGIPLLERSDDGGTTWMPLAPPALESQLRVIGVSPTDENVVFLRFDGDTQDELVRSADAGLTFQTVLTIPSDNLTAFVAMPDGKTFLAGSIFTGGDWMSTDGGLTWNKTTQQLEMACAGLNGDGKLYACGQNWKPDYMALGSSTDGQTWTKKMRFQDIFGPVACAAGTVQHDYCAGMVWGPLKTMFGADPVDASIGIDANPNPPPSSKGCGGCGVGLALVLVFLPRRRRPA
jgi:hypothetical protein